MQDANSISRVNGKMKNVTTEVIRNKAKYCGSQKEHSHHTTRQLVVFHLLNSSSGKWIQQFHCSLAQERETE